MSKLPNLVEDPKIIQQGLNVILECQAEAIPAPTSIWFKDETEIQANDSYKLVLEPQPGDKYKCRCEIQNFTKALAGIYKCALKNDQGQTTATFTVTSGEAPEFVEKPHIIQKDGGKILMIKVRVKSKTEPKIKWLKGEEEVKFTDRVTCSSKKDEKEADCYFHFLEIKGPIKEDEAKYTCNASNAEGSASQSLNLVFE